MVRILAALAMLLVTTAFADEYFDATVRQAQARSQELQDIGAQFNPAEMSGSDMTLFRYFSKVDDNTSARLDRLNTKLDTLNQRLDTMEQRFQLYLPDKYKPAED